MKTAVIKASNISIGYHKTTYGSESVLYSGLSFNLYQGELVCLLGQNGAGKSTLLRSLSSSQPCLSGDIYLNEKNLKEYTEAELSYKLGLVLTDKTSIGGFKVSQLVALGRYPYTGFWGRLTNKDKAIVQKAMTDVGIADKADVYIAQLSDGERQKVMIARALAQECPIVFLDEPTAFLDVASRIEIMNLLHTLAAEYNKSILLSTHDIELALLLADRLWLLSRDNGLECGATEDVVLSGLMDSFLSRNDIAFDMDSGSFYPKKNFNKFAYLHPETKNYRWISNFMQRNSWGMAQSQDEAGLIITDLASDGLQVLCEGETFNFSSFENLREWITLR